MKSVIRILNMDSQEDSKKIQNVISHNAGIIASQISLNKKEVTIVYDELSVKIEKILESIEDMGYLVI
ncbi:heavy-metal-associated domain-containing protein [uncultured Clostridium sp.]|uniref:heavy-metal-associated domain-containing protein n=1 Tax=uncultured Clostridium sp. TaxID=59620 RepID=UPI0025D9D192|nr:heavy metal-associated domain-containing protein [uncultured Clostridium sp.]